MMLSGDSGQGESISTPHSVSKRLFHHGGSSSKRKLFVAESRSSQDTDVSGEESDLGPMSPLALTDHSENSCDSSPGRPFVSPFTTPDKLPGDLKLSTWDRLRPGVPRTKSDERLSPFSALKMSTRAARSSPKRRILQNSPKSLPTTPRRLHIDERTIGTPEREIAMLFDGIVPETPQKDGSDTDDVDRIEETPQKEQTHERRLITPLGSVQKEIIVPRLHRRKSLGPFENEETSSPELKANTLKRHANDSLVSSSTKFPKIDENSSVPKARASLFQEKNNDPPKQSTELTVSTKSFYKTSGKRASSTSVEWARFEPVKKRHSLPSNMNNHRRASTRARLSDMNSGVRHGIKRPKPKRHMSRVEAFKTAKQKKTSSPVVSPAATKVDEKIKVDEKVNVDDPSLSNAENIRDPFSFRTVEAPPSPVPDPSKRFFKTNRTMKSNRPATVTVNEKIKLRVSDGMIALNAKRSRISSTPRKRTRVEDMSFDTADLTVDAPGFDTSIDKKNVDGILKVLEDDWADDDYDTMETLTTISPVKSIGVNKPNVLMSPASVLSNMTSSMNIKDGPKNARDNANETVANSGENSEGTNSDGKKLYPLFAKGFSSGIVE